MDRADRVDGKDPAYVSSGSVEEVQRLSVKPADEKRVNAPRVVILEHRPESDVICAGPSLPLNKRKGLRPLWLENGETLLRCDSDECFQHPSDLPRQEDRLQQQRALKIPACRSGIDR